MGVDHVGDLGRVDVEIQVAVHGHFAQLGDQAGVVLGGEEGGVDPEHLGDAQQHRDRQRADVVLDLVEIARRDLQHLRQRGLAESAFAAELAYPGADERLGHVHQRTHGCEERLRSVGNAGWLALRGPFGMIALGRDGETRRNEDEREAEGGSRMRTSEKPKADRA